MKSILIALIAASIGFFSFTKKSKSYSINDISNKIETAFSAGNSNIIYPFLDKEVELVIDGGNVDFQNISANQAKTLLDNFFKKNPPKSFNFVYKGKNSNTFNYSIANYKSNNNDYLLYLLIKKNKADKFIITTMQLKKN